MLPQALTREARLAFLTLAIELSVVDGRLSLSENHFCRFFADLFGVSPDGLRLLYRTTTGAELPEPGDPSSISWWESVMHRQQDLSMIGAPGEIERQLRCLALRASVGRLRRPRCELPTTWFEVRSADRRSL